MINYKKYNSIHFNNLRNLNTINSKNKDNQMLEIEKLKTVIVKTKDQAINQHKATFKNYHFFNKDKKLKTKNTKQISS